MISGWPCVLAVQVGPDGAVGDGASTALMVAVALATAAPCAALGVYVVLRRMAFVGDAMAHTLLPGLVVAALLGISLAAGALVAGLLTAIGIGWLSRRGQLREDTAIGILFTAMFALGVLLAGSGPAAERLGELLFGDLLHAGPEDLWLALGVGVLTGAALTLLHKELELASFDPLYAEVIGIRTDALRYLLLIALALVIVAAVQVVGVLLTAALLVTPAAAATLLTRRLPGMIGTAMLLAAGASLAGVWIGVRLRLEIGAAIVLACTVLFGIAWLLRIRRRFGV